MSATNLSNALPGAHKSRFAPRSAAWWRRFGVMCPFCPEVGCPRSRFPRSHALPFQPGGTQVAICATALRAMDEIWGCVPVSFCNRLSPNAFAQVAEKRTSAQRHTSRKLRHNSLHGGEDSGLCARFAPRSAACGRVCPGRACGRSCPQAHKSQIAPFFREDGSKVDLCACGLCCVPAQEGRSSSSPRFSAAIRSCV